MSYFAIDMCSLIIIFDFLLIVSRTTGSSFDFIYKKTYWTETKYPVSIILYWDIQISVQYLR
jgi:hypothetical protein